VTLLVVHDRLSLAAAMFAFAMGAWAAISALRGRGVDSGYMGAILVGEALLVVQALVGAALMLGQGARPDRSVHLLYGVTAVLVWPFVLTLTRGEGSRRESVFLSATSFFLWGLIMRAVDTARLG
jgi:hypothetical protein